MISWVVYALQLLLLAWLGALILVVGLKLLTGKISTLGLFHSPKMREGFDPERLSLFMLTLGIAFYYVLHTLQMPICTTGVQTCQATLPEIPQEVLYIFGGGQGAFIGGKFLRLNGWRLVNV